MFAFIFPGQGSQHVGMMAELAVKFPVVGELFSQASNVLDYDLWQLTQVGPEEALNQTEHTQPALLVAGVAVWRIWQSLQGASPRYMAGHSLGEYTALVCSGALGFEDAVKLVAARGRFMQSAVAQGQGGMAAIIGLAEADVAQLCEDASQVDQVVSPANYNSIGQIVIAGDIQALERAMVLAKERGAKLAKKLPVSVPSHCALMKPAAVKLADQLSAISVKAPQIPVVNNVAVTCLSQSADIKQALVDQLYSPVRWLETIQFFAREGVTTVVESGPNKVLVGLNKRIAEQMTAIAITQPEGIDSIINHVTDLNLVGE